MDRYSDKYQDHKQAVKADHYCYVCYSILLQHSVIRFLSHQSEEPLSTNQSRGPLSAFEANCRGELIHIINRFTTGEDNHPFMTLRDQLEIVQAVYPFAHDTSLPPGWTETRLILYIYTQIRQQRWDTWLRLPLADADKKLETFIHQQPTPLLPYPTQLLALLHQVVVTVSGSTRISDESATNITRHLPAHLSLLPYHLYRRFIENLMNKKINSVADWLPTQPYVDDLYSLFELREISSE